MKDWRTKHGRSRTPEYRVWIDMRRRCHAPNDTAYHDYGARGITVCERWQSFENFIADMGEKPTPQHTIERLDNERGYEPGNCVWATRAVQQRNRRNNVWVELDGEKMCVRDAAQRLGLSNATLRSRLRKMPPEQALRRERLGHGAGVKLTASQVAEIRALVAGGATHRETAARFGVARSTVSMIARGQTWRH